MESSRPPAHTAHITMEELERFASIDEGAPTLEQMRLLMRIYEKIETCEVCLARFQYFLHTEEQRAALERAAPCIGAAVLLRQCLSQMDEALRQRAAAWLDGARQLLGDAGRVSLQPAATEAMRGAAATAADGREVALSPTGDGGFRFSLKTPMTVEFHVCQEDGEGCPVCLVVAEEEGRMLPEVYPLFGIALPGFVSPLLRTRGISFAAGTYILYIPAAAE